MAMGSRSNSSSSMATAQSCFSYDVFLSFRGEDTRRNFTDHLYTALKQAGIRTFRDDDAMDRGKLLKPELDKAIHESAVSVIVFSESYATSKWCLDEVLMIIEQQETSSSKHEIVPVFYNVDPSDVRNQTGSFKKAFDAYDDKVNAETNLEKKRELLKKVGAWRNSLNKAATLTGMVLTDGYESQFIINIVNVVIKKLDRKALYIEDKLVGIEERVAEINKWLQDLSNDAAVLLIDGMGGIGKSTIAKCIFNSNFRNYEGSCFLANVHEMSNQPGGLVRLQSQLLSTILKSEKEETIWNVDDGTNKVTYAISNKKVLLILDDVTTSEQLDALLGPQSFYPGSKVIITTRHTELSSSFSIHPKVHSVRTLHSKDAIELFSLYAFRQHQPIEPYIVQSKLVVHQCMGLPLALKVLGSSLRGKTNDVWEDTIRKLAAIPDPKIQKALQISYDTLEDDTVKELFLHIACFFEGDRKDYIVELLVDLYPVFGIKKLMDGCLLHVEDGRVMMHQLIKEMGREVVRQESPKDPGKRSRLWHYQDCIDVLQDQSGTEKVEGLMLDMQKWMGANSVRSFEEYLGKTLCRNDAKFKIGALEKMKNLMLLQLNYVVFSGKCKKLPEKLRLLRWHGCPLRAIPSGISLEKLVVLDMSYSKFKRVWYDVKVIRSLKTLNLSHCVELLETPDFDGLPGLESLIMKGCLSLTKVHESIVYLQGLFLLDLADCRSLRDLPRLPTSLVLLQIYLCPSDGVFGRVQHLNLSSLFPLLESMNISYCNLHNNSFPNDWSSLVSLMRLNIDGNPVWSFPKFIQTLPTIRCLTATIRCQLTVQTWPNIRYFLGRDKILSIHEVEGEIMKLELNAGEGVELGLEVFNEFLILSTFVSEMQISSRFMFKERGPQISFTVSRHPDNWRISGFNLYFMLSQLSGFECFGSEIEVYNRTKGVRSFYNMSPKIILTSTLGSSPSIPESGTVPEIPGNWGVQFTWPNIWPWACDSVIEGGDEIVISILIPEAVTLIQNCCINFLYDEVEERGGETKEAHHVNAFHQVFVDRWNGLDIGYSCIGYSFTLLVSPVVTFCIRS